MKPHEELLDEEHHHCQHESATELRAVVVAGRSIISRSTARCRIKNCCCDDKGHRVTMWWCSSRILRLHSTWYHTVQCTNYWENYRISSNRQFCLLLELEHTMKNGLTQNHAKNGAHGTLFNIVKQKWSHKWSHTHFSSCAPDPIRWSQTNAISAIHKWCKCDEGLQNVNNRENLTLVYCECKIHKWWKCDEDCDTVL